MPHQRRPPCHTFLPEDEKEYTYHRLGDMQGRTSLDERFAPSIYIATSRNAYTAQIRASSLHVAARKIVDFLCSLEAPEMEAKTEYFYLCDGQEACIMVREPHQVWADRPSRLH